MGFVDSDAPRARVRRRGLAAGALLVVGSALLGGAWIAVGMFMAFACDAARPNELIEGAFALHGVALYAMPIFLLALCAHLLIAPRSSLRRAVLVFFVTQLAWYALAAVWLAFGLAAQ